MVGHWMNGVFDACVRLLETWAAMTGLTYKEINVWLFCIVGPLALVALATTVVVQQRTIRRLRAPQRPAIDTRRL